MEVESQNCPENLGNQKNEILRDVLFCKNNIQQKKTNRGRDPSKLLGPFFSIRFHATVFLGARSRTILLDVFLLEDVPLLWQFWMLFGASSCYEIGGETHRWPKHVQSPLMGSSPRCWNSSSGNLILEEWGRWRSCYSLEWLLAYGFDTTPEDFHGVYTPGMRPHLSLETNLMDRAATRCKKLFHILE